MADGFLSIEETANALGVSTRHARRLADSGAVDRIARGLVDRASVDRYLRSHRQGRTRAWAEPTAWGAVAFLSGRDVDWLGTVQTSRLRTALRETRDVDELLTRMRDRTRVRTYEAHRAAIPRLRALVLATDLRQLGISDAVDGSVDGYLAEDDLDRVVLTLGLREATDGTVVLRTTGFDTARVRGLVDTLTVAALDAATSSDPRLRSAGRRALDDAMEAHR
ncbi:helix-turn-helix domain-containing protein [Lapillicoccus jejuensis]|uniref:Excisionase family DNA binding protein n=1 Tax=Lapillicoccus jejuensis TaxID=402171 RepID=A0A542E317_9MICO|nr:helix-turn-helix domain-containing protein [Lapillicoccus jejuensis]TQJ09730.1 hypothetical protein FB458_2844 [Lapillicoccus jejuensis]